MLTKLFWIKPLTMIALTILFATSIPIAAQSNLPQVQVIELSGEEPPPPGISKEVDFGFGGGGMYCTSVEAHRISGSGFSPPIQNGGFGLFIDCIDDLKTPIAIYFIGDVSSNTGKLLATRYITPSSARNALVEVKISRSFPIDSANMRIIIAQDGGFPGKEGGEWAPVSVESPCRGSSPGIFAQLNVGDSAYVIRLEGLDLMSDTNGSGTKLSALLFGTMVTLTGNLMCGFDGLTYWQVNAAGVTGWLPQGDLATDWLSSDDGTSVNPNPAQCTGALPSTLKIGQRAQVVVSDGTPANVRFFPDGTSNPFKTIPELTPMTIISHPLCGKNNRGEAVAYRLVQLDDGTKGWVVEVTPTLRVLEPVAPGS